MKVRRVLMRGLSCLLIAILAVPPTLVAQQAGQTQVFKQEELDQLLAPIALYPDSLIAQILIASTYPLEVVNADRFTQQNKNLKGDALTKALEQQEWDPSVKSLVNFPQVLAMMSEKLDWTQKLGDAFLADQKSVMDTIQSLREKAQASGNLKTTQEQTVVVEQKIIKIEPTNPQVIYVPAYNPTVVYGVWPYPAYPPYYYYPPGYVAARSAFWFAAGVGLGAAWGYAWGSPNWRGGSVNYNYNQNININTNINRNKYATTLPAGGQGSWQHNAANRKGVPYNNQAVAQRYNQASPSQQVQARQAYRGYTGSALTPSEQQQAQQRAQQTQQTRQQPITQQGQQQPAGQRAQPTTQPAWTIDTAGSRGGASQFGGGSGSRSSAFEGIDRGGSAATSAGQRGSASRSSAGATAGRSAGGGGGARRR